VRGALGVPLSALRELPDQSLIGITIASESPSSEGESSAGERPSRKPKRTSLLPADETASMRYRALKAMLVASPS
jgi:hypothetical protein